MKSDGNRHRKNDLKHMSVPEERRGALWWLQEFGIAERDVTSASGMADGADTEMLQAVAMHLLDKRLDRLALVDDTCDAILADLRAIDPELAELAERYYIRHETLAELAKERGVNVSEIYAKLQRLANRPVPTMPRQAQARGTA